VLHVASECGCGHCRGCEQVGHELAAYEKQNEMNIDAIHPILINANGVSDTSSWRGEWSGAVDAEDEIRMRRIRALVVAKR